MPELVGRGQVPNPRAQAQPPRKARKLKRVRARTRSARETQKRTAGVAAGQHDGAAADSRIVFSHTDFLGYPLGQYRLHRSVTWTFAPGILADATRVGNVIRTELEAVGGVSAATVSVHGGRVIAYAIVDEHDIDLQERINRAESRIAGLLPTFDVEVVTRAHQGRSVVDVAPGETVFQR